MSFFMHFVRIKKHRKEGLPWRSSCIRNKDEFLKLTNSGIQVHWHSAMSVTSIMTAVIPLIIKKHCCGKNQFSFSALEQYKALPLHTTITKSDFFIWRPCIPRHILNAIWNSHIYIALLVLNTYVGRIHCFTVCSGSNCKSDSGEYSSHFFFFFL